MAKKEMSPAPPVKIALYEKAVATVPGIERKGAKNPYTSLNGHMFSFLQPDGTMALRLGPTERAAFMKRYKAEHPVSYGAVMKEYVEVPASLLKRTGELAKHVAMSVAYIESLPPKPTTKNTAAKKKAAKKKTAGATARKSGSETGVKPARAKRTAASGKANGSPRAGKTGKKKPSKKK